MLQSKLSRSKQLVLPGHAKVGAAAGQPTQEERERTQPITGWWLAWYITTDISATLYVMYVTIPGIWCCWFTDVRFISERHLRCYCWKASILIRYDCIVSYILYAQGIVCMYNFMLVAIALCSGEIKAWPVSMISVRVLWAPTSGHFGVISW